MSPFVICSSCQRKLKVPETAVGKAIRCPTCKAAIPIAEGARTEGPEQSTSAPLEREGVTIAPGNPSLAIPLRQREREREEFADGEPRQTNKRMRKGVSSGLILGLVGGGVLLTLALFGGGVGMLVYFALNRSIPEADWQSFSPPGSGCTLLMPGTPVAKPSTINGVALDKYMVERKRERIVFGFAFLTLGANPLKANIQEGMFDAGRDELLRRMNGTLASERAITLGDVPGREIEVLASDGSRLVSRLYLARVGGANRFYEISAGGYAVSRDKGDVVRYFDSLRMDASATPPTTLGGPVAQGPQPPVFIRPRPNPAPPGRPKPRPKQRPNPPAPPGERAVWDETSGTQTISLAFSPDSATLAVGHWDKKLRLWDVAGGKDRRVIRTDDSGPVMAVAFSKDGKRLACDGDDGKQGIVLLWDVSDSNAPQQWRRIQVQHTRGKARAKALCFSADGKSLAVGLVPDDNNYGSQILLWDLENNKEHAALRDCKEPVKKLRFTPEGAIVVLMPGLVRVWDPAANRILREFKGQNPAEQFITSALSPDGKTLATMCQDKKLRMWRLSDGICQQTWPMTVDLIRQNGCPFEFTPNGKYLAMRGQGSQFHLWDAQTGKELKLAKGGASFENIDVMAFSPDSRFLAWHGNHGPKIMEVAALVAGN